MASIPESAWHSRGEWHDIATAPKDGTEFLAWDGNRVCIAEYCLPIRQRVIGGVRYCWYEDRKDGCVREDSYSHWQPLPPPPTLKDTP